MVTYPTTTGTVRDGKRVMAEFSRPCLTMLTQILPEMKIHVVRETMSSEKLGRTYYKRYKQMISLIQMGLAMSGKNMTW